MYYDETSLTSALRECKHSHLAIEQEQVFHKTAPTVTLKNYLRLKHFPMSTLFILNQLQGKY